MTSADRDLEGLPERRPTTSEPPTMWQPPDPPSIDGRCERCGFRGQVYRGRFGGLRCTVCFGLQAGWMPRGSST